MHQISRALVLSGGDFGESDRIITLFTHRFGKITVIAKGAKRSQRRFVNTLEAPGLIRAILRRGRGSLPLLESADLLDPYPHIRQDYRAYILASVWLDTTERLLKPAMREPAFFELLTLTLAGLNRGLNPLGLHLFFLLKGLFLAGFGPDLFSCRRCRENLAGEKVYFCPEESGFICRFCHFGGNLQPVSPSLLIRLRHLATSSLWQAEILNLEFPQVPQGIRILERLLFGVLGERPAAFKVYREICGEELIDKGDRLPKP
ncbi:DNA repair protein RecO [Thermosulfuriphilus sp.]